MVLSDHSSLFRLKVNTVQYGGNPHSKSGGKPVKATVRDGVIVDFYKIIATECDFFGELVAFFCLSGHMAEAIVACIQNYLDQGHHDRPYEDTIRDVMAASSDTGFNFGDITGLPWIEIDFTRDIAQARNVILPRIRKKLGKVLRVGAGKQSITSSQSNQ